MFHLQASSHGVGDSFQGRANPPLPSNVDGPHASFAETYPSFPAWQYEIMNPNGSYRFVNLGRPEYTPNVS